MLKIDRQATGEVVFSMSGRLEAESLNQLSALLEGETSGQALVLDLKGLVLADREAVRFLRTCESRGVQLRNCPPYIKAWIAQEEGQP